MLPWQRKSILIMFCMLQFAFFAFSIARNLQFVEMDFQMSPCRNIALEVCLRPAELPGGTQIPAPFIQVQLCLQNDYILCPADFHGQLQQFRLPAIRPVEVPHPAQIARGEAGSILVTAFQVFGSCDSGALFRPVTDQSAQLAVQLHLRHSGGHCRIHSGKHGRVIDVFADVHGFLLSGRICLIQKQTKEKRRSISCASLWPVLHHLHHLLPEQNEAVIDDFVVVVMSEQPVVELRLFSDFLQEVGQVVVDIIIDGEAKGSQRKKVVKCPFCDSSMQDKQEQRIAYAQASQVELDRITMQLDDLKEAEKDIQQEICVLEAQLQELNRQNNEITIMISRGLKPKAGQLRDMLESYKRIVQIKHELSAVDAMSVDLNSDAFEREMEEEGEKVVFKPMEHIDMERWKQWSDTFEMIVKECNYPNCGTARISPDTYDAIVNGKHKSDEGKGYRAFLNSIVLFSLMKTLEGGGAYRPAMLILDSPILTLKEKVRKDELADPGMRTSLFRYMVDNCGDNQIIIAENEIPSAVDYSTAHLIEFTQDETQGVYGFLKSVRNSVDS